MDFNLPPRRMRDLRNLMERFALSSQSISKVNFIHLDLALTHITASTTHNYEQLEFLGDGVLRLIVAEFLLTHYPTAQVGELAAVRDILGSDRTLFRLAESYGIERFLLASESACGDQDGRKTRLAESFEAILGALYLSTHTLELIRPWLKPHLKRIAMEVMEDPARQNYKAALQEWSQGQFKEIPTYQMGRDSQMPGDPQRFTVEVWLQEECLAQGKGRTIKAAEQEAAQIAFLSRAIGPR
ncbi:MAG: putative dsRNA-binding protein [Cyanobacteria bacterium LVE1205-1]|jgi:ribonuclease III|nr:ribonuclease III family protein [Cyanobacteria bacterium WB6_1B_304]